MTKKMMIPKRTQATRRRVGNEKRARRRSVKRTSDEGARVVPIEAKAMRAMILQHRIGDEKRSTRRKRSNESVRKKKA
jgi:hypothetical protein